MKEEISAETLFELGTCAHWQAQWDGAEPTVGEILKRIPTGAVAIPLFLTVVDG